MKIETIEDARRIVENIRKMYPLVGDPELNFITKESGQPVAVVVTIDATSEGDAWYEWRKVVGKGGGAYDQRRVRIKDPVEFVYRYRKELSRMFSVPAVPDVPESAWWEV